MFGKNLKYYRLKNNMSMKELADLVQISPMAISHYEKEERRPDMQTIKALAKALQVRVTDFLANRDNSLEFCHGEFRKNSKLSAKQQEFVKEEVEEYFGRFYQTVNILGGEVLPDHPALHSLELSDSVEENALKMREKDVENMANAISGAFLFPISDMKRELGVRRSAITNDMIGVCIEYGISMYMLVMRANKSGIINDYVTKNFYINANKAGWRKNEPSRAKEEETRLFYQLVYRAVTENEITAQKGAELLHESYEKVMEECSTMEV